MTSRFGKTYSRKGGEANSKFDEVFSNKKATLSTKWGETTYKAQLASKRPLIKQQELPEISKRPRVEEDDGSDDPFGFDSDDESKAVTSIGTPQPGNGSGQDQVAMVTEKPQAKSSFIRSSPSSDSESSKADKPLQTTVNISSWSKSAKPASQFTSLKPLPKDPSDGWNSEGSQRSSSPGEDSLQGRDDSGESEGPSGVAQEQGDGAGMPPQPEPLDFDQLPLLKSTTNRTYHRPKRHKDLGQGAQAAPVKDSKPAPAPAPANPSSSGVSAPPSAPQQKAAGRGRVRDYTVLHPSCVSVCNVTIQDAIERTSDELTSTAAPTDLGEAGTFRRKTDAAPAKPTRFRPTQSKSKKETKLEFFGFEENEGQEASGEATASGSTSYKIKYFGFDELSESDSDDDDDVAASKKARKAASAQAAAAAMSFSADSPQMSDSQDSQSSTNTDSLEFPDESILAGSEGHKTRQGKQSDKSKDIGRKIFKKSPAKAVYNARHWNEPEELPPPAPTRTISAPASLSSSSGSSSSGSGSSSSSSSSSSKDTNSHKDDGVFKAPPPPPKVIKSVTIPTQPYQDIVTALKCRKEHKELYTVVHNVKHFNDVVEFGENQEFTDDFEYLETGLKSGQPLNTRCLSIISLATRCALPGFRMHLRARGKVASVFKMLNDAPQHPNLALCTASLMYILSRDRLNMDLDRACLELMIRLLELEQDNTVDDQLTAKEMSKVKEKIRKLCETVHNKHLDLENITSGHLAMETLLSLTSKRAGDWFKEELRLLGGLDHIVDKVKECVLSLSQEEDKEMLVASLWGAERCLRVLESVTVHNPENQAYLIAYKDSQLIVSAARGLRYCEDMIQRYSREVNSSVVASGSALPHCSHSNVGKAVEDCMRAVIGVLLNLTHDNEWGSTKAGEQEELLETALNCVLRVPRYLPQEQRFDIRVLGLGLLINLVEYSSRNRHSLMEMHLEVELEMVALPEPEKGGEKEAGDKTTKMDEQTQPEKRPASGALAALVHLFLERERAAILAEAQTDEVIIEAPKPQDQSGEWQETSGEIQWVASENNDNDKDKDKKEEEEEELDFNKALQHAGKHMEDSIVASYTALLLGCLCQGSPANVTTVRENLPKGDFSIMTEMLKKFLNFMNLTCAVGTTGQKSISRVIDYLEHC
ncbi:wings apart-like protein homolog isoform X1 [Alosa sapidissima]|uniref:wings apart-like protein homolog isoform X1 n=1 Tax=Alosa sapidissima TaxID=34773 RepID=UPI001C08BA19|nr:wings apart-like protein homolog isoform X1 [Alosa sapidissima]